MKWINQAKYFSIDVMGRHAICPCFMYCKSEYHETELSYIKLPNNERILYKLSDIHKVNANEMMGRIDDLLEDTEEYYPEDTWLTLRIYNKDFEIIYEKSDSSEVEYGTARDIVREFLQTGEYRSEKMIYLFGDSYWT